MIFLEIVKWIAFVFVAFMLLAESVAFFLYPSESLKKAVEMKFDVNDYWIKTTRWPVVVFFLGFAASPVVGPNLVFHLMLTFLSWGWALEMYKTNASPGMSSDARRWSFIGLANLMYFGASWLIINRIVP